MTERRWQFWIDRGGTFTDVVAVDPEGQFHALKVLSERHSGSGDAALDAIRQFLDVPLGCPLPHDRIASVKMGTTVATNALLQRRGEPTVLVITAGFEDQLEIGTQARSDIFARQVIKKDMLYRDVIGARERVRASGDVERPLDADHLQRALARSLERGSRAAAVVFLHGYRFPEHERIAAAIARDVGFRQISVSHEVSPLIKIVGRGDTTVADAYLSPVVARYVGHVRAALQNASAPAGDATKVWFMASSGGLKDAEHFHGRDAVLSGPAGGVVAMAGTAAAAGFAKVIGFDMGGTSTDVSHYAGDFERTFETEVAGVRMTVPMLKMHTVAAGGGSILKFEGGRMQVGPQSAGSDPGPACYRRGGPLTVTDANVMVGKLQPHCFPKLFGPSGTEPIDAEVCRRGFQTIADAAGADRDPYIIADGFIRIAVENMANAIKKISVHRGHDPAGYALNCFGSAGGQHACQIADTIGIRTILIHPMSGVLSAFGMGLAPLKATRERSIEIALDAQALRTIAPLVDQLVAEVTRELIDQGVELATMTITRRAHMRYDGNDTALTIALGAQDTMRRKFEAEHLQRFGFVSPEKSLTIAAIEAEAVSQVALAAHDAVEANAVHSQAPPPETQKFFSKGRWHAADVHRRENLAANDLIDGPALVIESHQTVVVEDGWRLSVSERNDLILTRIAAPALEKLTTAADPALLEVFNNSFMAIAEQMGEALRATAQSVNIKERLDFSCAVFDSNGGLVSNAPHLPVHLGSMDRSVESVIRACGSTMKPGDSFMLNAPYNGGTHLPDITVVTPVFDDPGANILFFVASRGHHEDIGGLTPGSMTPRATTIEEEGVLIDNVKIVDNGSFLEADVLKVLTTARYPARQPAKNVADLKAQVAANARGAAELNNMMRNFGIDVVRAYMHHVQNNAEESVRRLISRLRDGAFRIETDQGAIVHVAITVDHVQRTAKIDFSGTSAMQPNNFNAPEPVTRAAVLYVFRVMADEPIPLNAGCLRPLEIIIPPGSMLSPHYPAAVVAGNTETSQIVTNALFAALGALAPSQGTMNNLTFGNDRLQYYETICSGAPAGPGFDGAAAVHVHMTNTRLTDPEILELRYPVVVEEFAIRRGSGGRGKYNSGDGVKRVLRFLQRMELAILSGFRRIAPLGLNGGEPGQIGRNVIRRANGQIENLGGCCETVVEAGDAIIIETPTGGGYGA